MPAADLVRRMVDEPWNGRRLEVANELFGQFGAVPPAGRTATCTSSPTDGGIKLWSIKDSFGHLLRLGTTLTPPKPA